MSDLTQHKKLLVIGALVVLYLAIVYLERYSKGKKGNILDFLRTRLKGKKGGAQQLKDNTLNINMGAKKFFVYKIGLGTVLLGMVIFFMFPNPFTLITPFLILLVEGIYVELMPAPGIYKNGKYLGTVYTAFIKGGNGLTLGKKRGTETIGALKILRNGGVVAELH